MICLLLLSGEVAKDIKAFQSEIKNNFFQKGLRVS